jgi:hypothetical protein
MLSRPNPGRQTHQTRTMRPLEISMRLRAFLTPILCLAIAACGNSRNDSALDACAKAISEKLAGKTFELDRSDMAAHVKDEAADTLMINSTATFDKGLLGEYKQTFDCRVRFEKAGAPSVIWLQFNWNKEDLRKAGE